MSIPEVFIIESLSVEDQIFENYEGRILYEALKLQNKKPIYYYLKTEGELAKVPEAFEKSGYRYLHCSCHGDMERLFLTTGSVTYERFSTVFKDKLAKKRLFMSACMTGNDAFSEAVFANNPELISITAPQNKPFIQDLSVFWAAMYNRLNFINNKSINGKALRYILNELSRLFGVDIYYSNVNKKYFQFNDKRWINKLEEIAEKKSKIEE